ADAARVTAKLTDSKTGRGVAGGRVEFRVMTSTGDTLAVAYSTSAADGSVEALVPAGVVSATPLAPTGYAVVKFSSNRFNQSTTTDAAPVQSGAMKDFGSFALVPTVEVRGTVVGPDGTSVVGATVSVGYSGTNFYAGKPVTSAADGTFVI